MSAFVLSARYRYPSLRSTGYEIIEYHDGELFENMRHPNTPTAAVETTCPKKYSNSNHEEKKIILVPKTLTEIYRDRIIKQRRDSMF